MNHKDQILFVHKNLKNCYEDTNLGNPSKLLDDLVYLMLSPLTRFHQHKDSYEKFMSRIKNYVELCDILLENILKKL